MTNQVKDYLWYNNFEYKITSEPLYELLQQRRIEFVEQWSNNWKGYHSIWEIRGNSLFLINLKAYIDLDKVVDIQFLFPGKTEVFAKWFTGEIHFPDQYIFGYGGIRSRYIKSFNLKFVNGVLTFYNLMDSYLDNDSNGE